MTDRRARLDRRAQNGALRVDLPGLTLRVVADRAVPDELRAAALRHREQLDAFLIARRAPDSVSEQAPRVVRLVAEAALRCGLAPADAAAGAIVQALGEELLADGGEVVVEAPGLSFVAVARDRAVSIDGAGRAFTIWVAARHPAAVFSSSTRLHALPGAADAVVVVADGCAVAEAAGLSAAALATGPHEVQRALTYLREVEGVRAAFVVCDVVVGVFGDLRIETG